MQRINTATAVPDLHGPGKKGFRNGNKALGVQATQLSAEYFNALQEEIANVIEATGGALNPADNTQLLTALSIILSNADIAARFTTTANINLNGLAVQAGGDWAAALTAGDIVLVKDQAVPQNNGWYVSAAGAWVRVNYLDASAEIKAGMLTKVTEGATLADTLWMLTTDAPIVLNTSALNFARKDGNQLVKASQAQAEAGADDINFMTALKTLQAIRASWKTSGELSFAWNTLATHAHSFGSVPKEFKVVIVIKTTHSGLNAGEVFDVTTSWAFGNYGQSCFPNATNMYFNTAASGTFVVTQAGALVTPTPSNCKLIFYWR